MLKVTVIKEDSVEKWDLEGKLSGDWVKELERCWRESPPKAGVSIQVNLKAVSYIDAAGKQLLSEMHEQGAEIKGCGCMARAVVEEIVRFVKGSRTPSKKILAVIVTLLGAYFLGSVANAGAHEKSLRRSLVQVRASGADAVYQLARWEAKSKPKTRTFAPRRDAIVYLNDGMAKYFSAARDFLYVGEAQAVDRHLIRTFIK